MDQLVTLTKIRRVFKCIQFSSIILSESLKGNYIQHMIYSEIKEHNPHAAAWFVQMTGGFIEAGGVLNCNPTTVSKLQWAPKRACLLTQVGQ